MINGLKKIVVSLLVVLLLASCGAEPEPKFDYTMNGEFFTIGYPKGFSTSKLESGGIVKGNEFTINIDVEPYAAAREGDVSSIESKKDSIKSGLKDYEIEELKSGVIISGKADKGDGIVLLYPVDFYIINVYTAPTPNSKAGSELALEMIKTFEVTDPDYFLQKEVNKNNSSMADNENLNTEPADSSNDENAAHENTQNDSSVDAPNDESFENEYVSFVIPKEWELTLDDKRITIIEPRMDSSLDVLSFSIQYVDLGDSIGFDDFVSGIQSQTNGKKRAVEYSGTKYQLIQSSHSTYYEFHLITKASSGNPVMISVVSVANSLPEDAVKIIGTIEIK